MSWGDIILSHPVAPNKEAPNTVAQWTSWLPKWPNLQLCPVSFQSLNMNKYLLTETKIENSSETNGETEPGKTYSHALEVSDDRHIGVREERSKETAHYCSAQ